MSNGIVANQEPAGGAHVLWRAVGTERSYVNIVHTVGLLIAEKLWAIKFVVNDGQSN